MTELSILILSGSGRRPSYTRSLCGAIETALEARGAAPVTFDLAERRLPLVEPRLRQQRDAHPDANVAEFYRLARAADAFVLASPVYHNSYSGLLKNALDYLMLTDFRKKPVGLASQSGRSTQAVDHLRIVVRGILGVAITTQVCTHDADFGALGADDLCPLTAPDIVERIDRFADELVLFAAQLRTMRAAAE